jgi:hypothetical protein
LLFLIKFINEIVYSHGGDKISSLSNRALQEVQDLTSIMSLTKEIPFCYQMNYPRKLFHASFKSEDKQNIFISECQCC